MQAKHFYAFGPFRIDSQERILRREGQPVSLTPKAIDILLVLIESAERLVDKDQLMKQVWPDAFVEEGNLTKNIFVLRKALGSAEDGREYIETVPRRGYRFSSRVETSEDEQRTEAITERPLRKDIPAAGPGKIERIDRGKGYALARQPEPIDEAPQTAVPPERTAPAAVDLPREGVLESDTKPRPYHSASLRFWILLVARQDGSCGFDRAFLSIVTGMFRTGRYLLKKL